MDIPLAIEYLKEFKLVAPNWFKEHNFINQRLNFFKEFKNRQNLEKAEWLYFQALGQNINSFASNPLARGNALGRPNHEMEYYRECFINLLHGSESIETRIESFIHNIRLFNISSTSEIIGNCFPEEYVFYNGIDKSGADILSVDPGYTRGDTIGVKFVKFNIALKPLISLYNEIVGQQTSAFINLEIDQFLYWLATTKNKTRYWAGGYHWDDENMFDSFIENGYWQIGWGKDSEKGAPFYKIINDVSIGDYLALKSLGGQYDLKISAIGKVTDNSEKDEGKLEIEWICLEEVYTGKAPKGQNAGNWFGTLLEVKRNNDINLLFNKIMNNHSSISIDQLKEPMKLNTILYGPPGTGKTYQTIPQSVNIANPDFFRANNIDLKANSYTQAQYSLIQQEFNRLKEEGRIAFITFHQNYSYEDFIQGLKPGINKNQLYFNKVDGIFRKIAINALFEQIKDIETSTPSSTLSFDSLYNSMIANWKTEEEKVFKTKDNYEVVLISINDRSNLRLAHRVKTNKDTQTVNGGAFYDSQSYDVSRERLKKLYEHFGSKEKFAEMSNINNDIRAIIGGCNATIYWTVLNQLFEIKEFWEGNSDKSIEFEKEDSLSYEEKVSRVNSFIAENGIPTEGKPFVLIIDEINRANISRVFGDLITLIEADKRWGNAHQLAINLPSGDLFTVPNNLYIIGTMNTADKSIALIDIALRRRFSFKSLYPDYDLMGNYSELIKSLNEKLYGLKKSADFMIGHSFFVGKVFNDAEVAEIFNSNIIPLLEEYLPHYKAADLKNLLTGIGLAINEPSIDNNYQLECIGLQK